MKKVVFGTMRFIELFSPEDEEHIHAFDGYTRAFQLYKKTGESYVVIGSVNAMEPVLSIDDKEGIVVVHSSTENRLITLAKDPDQFLEIVSAINKVWKDHPDKMFLPRNSETLLLFKQFKEYITAIPGIDAGYWIDFAFKELDIYYKT